MNQSVKTALTAAGALLGVTAAAAAAVSKLFVDGALRREQPRLFRAAPDKMSGAAPQVPLPAETERSAQRLLSDGGRRVEITAADGVVLVGHLFSAERPKRVILAMHGWRSAWNRDFSGIAPFWFSNECTVLFVEQRAHGESGGSHIGFGLLERRDVLSWLRWLNHSFAAKLPVYLAGISMGATTVLLSAELPLPENVRGIMADCGFTSMDEIWRHVAREDWRLPYDLLRPLIFRMARHALGSSPDAANTRAALRGAKIPVLLVHGLGDRFVPPEMSRENYAACAVPGTRLLLIPEAGHGLSYLYDQAGYERAVLEFWCAGEAAPAGT